MPRCHVGEPLYKVWSDYAEVVDILKYRRLPMQDSFRPDFVTSLTYEEAMSRGAAAQKAFLEHHHYCESCRDATFR